ncbi:MAG: ATP-binding protein [Pseudonocardiaceae bacterium]
MINPLPPLRQLIEVPLLGQPDQTMTTRLRTLRRALLPALTAAYTASSPLVFTWARSQPGEPVQVLVGGGLVSSTAESSAWTAYPPGALSIPAVFDPNLWQYWIPCIARHDPLTVTEDHTPDSETTGVLEDLLPHLGQVPFVWLTVCQPACTEWVDEELENLHDQTTRLLDRQNMSARHTVEVERIRGRYRELSRGAGGIWHIRILAAGANQHTATSAAALVCATADLHPIPYLLRPGKPASFAEAITTESITATGELVAAIARPPAREISGIRVVEPARFDLTPETSHGIPLGTILDEVGQPAATFHVPTATLNRHTFVAGATGAGKSQTVRHLLEQLHHAQIPWLVIEPAKAEYARMAGRIGADQLVVIRPGDPQAIPVGLNPLEPEPGFGLQTHIDLVRALFLAAFEAIEPFPQVLAQALTRCYSDLGWNLVLGDSGLDNVTPKYPSLTNLQNTALDVVDNIGYSKEITDNVRGFINVRIGSLRLGTPGRFFEGGHPLDITDLLRRNVVLEIEDIGNDQDKAFFIGAVLIRLYEHLRIHHTTTGPTTLGHITVVEEAHRLLKRVEPGTPAAHAVELFTALLAEIRAYGEGLVIAEQIPAKIAPDVIKNTALKIIHRLPAADDRDTVGATMNLDQAQSRHVVSLPPGRAAIFADGMDRPLRITVPLGERRENTTHTNQTVAITRTRSTACGSMCRTRACTLRQTNHAEKFANKPEFTLWIELLTIAHLVGQPAPQPDKTWLDDLKNGTDQRILECAIAHRIQTAIDIRYTGLAAYYQPEQLATHLACIALAQLEGTAPSCDGSEIGWQAGRYRWADVLRSLGNDTTDKDQPHPDTALWAHRGLPLTGGTQTEQQQQLLQHPDLWQPPPSIITGTRILPAQETLIQLVIDQLSTVADPRTRYHNATGFLQLPGDWPLSVLDIPDSSPAGDQT